MVAGVGERGEELVPVDVAEARELRGVVFAGVGEDADLVELFVVDANVLGMNVEEPVFEFPHRSDEVHLLPDHVRRVIVEADVVAEVIEEATPDFGAGGDVLAARPFVLGKQHGAILDADTNAIAGGELNKGLPRLKETGPIVID